MGLLVRPLQSHPPAAPTIRWTRPTSRNDSIPTRGSSPISNSRRTATSGARTPSAGQYDKIDVPCYLIGGLLDGYRDSIPRMLENMKVPIKAEIGPYNHAWPDDGTPGPNYEWRHEAVRFWDQWLKGRDTGVRERPPPRRLPQGRARSRRGAGRRRRAAGSPRTGRSRERPGRDSSPRDRPARRRPGRAGRGVVVLCPDLRHEHRPVVGRADRRHAARRRRQPGLRQPAARRRASRSSASPGAPAGLGRRSSRALGGPAGGRLPGRQGLARRGGGPSRRPAEFPARARGPCPGRIYDLEFEMHFTTWTFAPGHRVRLSVTNSLFPMIWPTPHPMTTRLATGTRSDTDRTARHPRGRSAPGPAFRAPEKREERGDARDLGGGAWPIGFYEWRRDLGEGDGRGRMEGDVHLGDPGTSAIMRPKRISTRRRKRIRPIRASWARTATGSSSPAGPSIC